MLLMLVALDQSSSVVVQLYCLSLLLCGEFFLRMLACRLGLSSPQFNLHRRLEVFLQGTNKGLNFSLSRYLPTTRKTRYETKLSQSNSNY